MNEAAPISSKRMKVLVVDDDEHLREALKEAVVDLGYVCAVAKDGLEAWELHRKWHFDVVLSDWLMPGLDGVELCRRMRVDSAEAYTYFILVTGLSDREHLVHGLNQGADEYLTKPVDVEELEVRLKSAARVASMNRKLVERTASLRHESERALKIARIDPLTGINNRFSLTIDLNWAMAQASRYGHKYTIALCDVDFFKRFNDKYGHVAGDEVLKGVAEAMGSSLREGDRLYRYGGEEFLILLPEQTQDAGAVAMERLRQSVEALGIAHAASDAAKVVTVSAGIAEYDAARDVSPEDWLRRADAALYRAKERGRNRVAVEGIDEPTA